MRATSSISFGASVAKLRSMTAPSSRGSFEGWWVSKRVVMFGWEENGRIYPATTIFVRYAGRMLRFVLLIFFCVASAAEPDWNRVNEETLRHYQTLIRLDTTDPPGNETRVAEYVKKVFEAE